MGAIQVSDPDGRRGEAVTIMPRRNRKTDRSFDEWEDSEAKKDLKHRLEQLRAQELEDEDDYAEFDPMVYYERDETVGDE